MIIDREECVGCLACVPYCPVEAIQPVEDAGGKASRIDQDQCVECGVCLRAVVCPADAIHQPELAWPRSVRMAFSNPTAPHRGGEMGRGTEEMKTNEVTGLFRRGVAGVAVEMGRPGVGTSLRDVETVLRAVTGVSGVEFAPNNPVTNLIADRETGALEAEVLGERVLSAIIEFHVPAESLAEVLGAVRDASARIDTVFSLDLISRVEDDGTIPVLDAAREAGFDPRPNCKVNIGLGRPLKEED